MHTAEYSCKLLVTIHTDSRQVEGVYIPSSFLLFLITHKTNLNQHLNSVQTTFLTAEANRQTVECIFLSSSHSHKYLVNSSNCNALKFLFCLLVAAVRFCLYFSYICSPCGHLVVNSMIGNMSTVTTLSF